MVCSVEAAVGVVDGSSAVFVAISGSVTVGSDACGGGSECDGGGSPHGALTAATASPAPSVSMKTDLMVFLEGS